MACRLYSLIPYKRDLSALSAVHSIERNPMSPERAFNIVLDTAVLQWAAIPSKANSEKP